MEVMTKPICFAANVSPLMLECDEQAISSKASGKLHEYGSLWGLSGPPIIRIRDFVVSPHLYIFGLQI